MAKMTFQFLDVGQGDSTLVQIRPDGKNYDELVLVDCGEKRSPFKVPSGDALNYLKATINANSVSAGYTVPYVDVLFITHPDSDHYNLLPALVSGPFSSYGAQPLRFGKVYFGGNPADYPCGFLEGLNPQSPLATFENGQHAKITPSGTVVPDWEFANGSVKVYLLSVNYPSRGGVKANPKSVVLLFDLKGKKVTLQGDAEENVESYIRQTFAHVPGFLKAWAMKLGHHGSRRATSAAWVKQLQPRALFASGDMAWAHPYCEPICRALKNTGAMDSPPFPVWYCCGEGHNENRQYFNNLTNRAVCMNLWYVVKELAENLAVGDMFGWKQVVCAQGTTFGVQWALEVGENHVEYLITPRAVPAPGQHVQPPFDCSKVWLDTPEAGLVAPGAM